MPREEAVGKHHQLNNCKQIQKYSNKPVGVQVPTLKSTRRQWKSYCTHKVTSGMQSLHFCPITPQSVIHVELACDLFLPKQAVIYIFSSETYKKLISASCQSILHNILPEKRSHSSPRRFSGIPFCTSSLVLVVRYMHIPLPYSKKWMFQDSSFIFSFAFTGINTAILGDQSILMLVGQVISGYSSLHFTKGTHCDI